MAHRDHVDRGKVGAVDYLSKSADAGDAVAVLVASHASKHGPRVKTKDQSLGYDVIRIDRALGDFPTRICDQRIRTLER
jgi:ActR/RegA family two-component response regulator